jgi:formyltetrahydrofolate synthetase
VCEVFLLNLCVQADLGIAVQKACEQQNGVFKFLYPLDLGIKEKIGMIAKSYGADGVEYSLEVGPLMHFHP